MSGLDADTQLPPHQFLSSFDSPQLNSTVNNVYNLHELVQIDLYLSYCMT